MSKITASAILKIAKSQVGYLEKATNSKLDDFTANAGRNNYTKFGRDMAKIAPGTYCVNMQWCDAYVDWCFVKAAGVTDAKKILGGWSGYTPTSAGYFKNKGQWHTSNPKPGDVIFFLHNGIIGHTGIVYKVDSTYVYTYEGNTSSSPEMEANGGCCRAKKYTLNYSLIAGYGRPAYSSSAASEQPSNSSKKGYTGKYPTVTASSNLKKGSKGENVKLLQKYLNWFGGYCLSVDGDFGTKTAAAVSKFQKAVGIKADSIFGTGSLKAAKAVKK